MTTPLIIDGKIYEQVSSKQAARDLAIMRKTVATGEARYAGLVQLEDAIHGSSIPLQDGWERLVEFSAERIRDTDFENRYATWDGLHPRKFEMYPLESGYGNCIYRDLYTPGYDSEKRAWQFSLDRPRGGNPSLVTLDESPLFGYGHPDPNEKGPRALRAEQRFLMSFEIEFSDNALDMLSWVIANTERNWLRLVQIKNTSPSSWYNEFVLALDWDRDGGLAVRLRGDTRTKRPDELETSNDVLGLPITPGLRQRFQLESILDPTGQASLTNVWWDGQLMMQDTRVNCVPRSDGHDPTTIGICRGPYLGGYLGMTPYRQTPEQFSVWYSNISIDSEI